MAIVNMYNLGSVGIAKDIPSHLLPPEAWTDGTNMRMQDGMAKRWLEPTAVFGTPNVAPGFVLGVPVTDSFYWLYTDLVSAHVYDGSSHTDITRGAGPYTAQEYREWNGCLLAGVPILNNGHDVPQYWSDLNPAVPLSALPAWPSTLRAKVVRNFGPYLVAVNLIDNGSALLHAVRWSSKADPGTVPASWDPTDATVDTGQTHLTDAKGGEILDAQLLGTYLIIYKEQSTHIMRFVGGADVFGFDLLFDQGLINPRSAVLFDSGVRHFCVGLDDIYIHTGTKNVEYPIDRKSRRYLYSDMDDENKVNAFAFENPQNEEIWYAYPTEGMEFPNKAMVWNFRSGDVTFRDFSAVSVALGRVTQPGTPWDSLTGSWDNLTTSWNKPGSRRLVAADLQNTRFLGLDTEYSNASSLSFLQRTGLAIIGKDRAGQPKADFQNIKLYKRIWPKISGDANVDVRLGVQDEISGPVTWTPYKTYDRNQRFLDFEISGRFCALEFRSLQARFWQLEGYDLELEVLGEH